MLCFHAFQEDSFIVCQNTVWLYWAPRTVEGWSDVSITPPSLALGQRISLKRPSLTMTSWRTWSCHRSRRLWTVCTPWNMAKTAASSRKEMWDPWCMSWKVWLVTCSSATHSFPIFPASQILQCILWNNARLPSFIGKQFARSYNTTRYHGCLIIWSFGVWNINIGIPYVFAAGESQ